MALEIQPWLGLRHPVSAGTHFLGLLAAVAATSCFWRLCRRETRKWLALTCFGLGMVAVYCASTVYHAAGPANSHLQLLRRFDHSAIYLLIAATYTPVLTVLLGQHLRWRAMACVLWLAALWGITCKWLLPFQPYYFTMSLYLGMGWMGVLPLAAIQRACGWRGLFFAAGGGIVYTAGALADLNGWPVLVPGIIGSHELMHVCTMAGSGCHVIFMYCWVVPHGVGPVGILAGSESDSTAARARPALTSSGLPPRPRNAG
jgi:hemolysin III